MMKRSMKRIYLKAFLAAFFAYLVGVLPILFATGGRYLYAGDYNVQMVPFFQHMAECLQNGIPLYDWNTNLGLNYIGAYTFYGLASPFQLLLSLFPISLFPYALTFVNALKFGVSAWGAALYCTRYLKKQSAVFICGMLYAFLGIQLYSLQAHFSDSLALFPFLLFALDAFVLDKRRGLFALTAALCAFTNYYFFWGEVVFLLLYFCVKLYKKEFRISVKQFALLALESLLGTLSAFVVLLPVLSTLSDTTRAQQLIFSHNLLAYEDTGVLWRAFSSAFLLPDWCNVGILFSDYQLNVSAVSLYIPLFFCIGAVYILRRNRKQWYTLLLGICALMAAIPVLNSVFSLFNKNYYARWFYMPLLILILLTGRFLDEFEQAEFKQEFWGTAICLAFFSAYGAFVLITQSETYGRTINTYFASSVIASTCMLALLYYIRYFKGEKRLNAGHLSKLTVGSCCLVLLICSVCVVSFSDCSFLQDALDNTCNEGEPVKIEDDGFFRTSTCQNEFSNATMNWGYSTIDAFHSLIPETETDFYDLVGLFRRSSNLTQPRDYAISSFLSVKYELYFNALLPGGVTVEPEDVPFEKTGFEQREAQNRYIVYENTAFIPMGFTYDYYLNTTDFTPLSIETEQEMKEQGLLAQPMKMATAAATDNEKLLLKAIWLDDAQIEKYGDLLTLLPDNLKEDTSEETYFTDCKARAARAAYEFLPDDTGFSSKINLEKENLVFYSVPYSKGFTAYVDGTKTEIERVFGGLCAVRVPAGDHAIRFTYEVQGLAAGKAISLVCCGCYAVYLLCVLISIKRQKTKSAARSA